MDVLVLASFSVCTQFKASSFKHTYFWFSPLSCSVPPFTPSFSLSPPHPPFIPSSLSFSFHLSLLPSPLPKFNTRTVILPSSVTDSLTKLDTDQKVHTANYAGGEKAGKSWTDRVMNVKQTTEEPKVLPQDTLEGVDEDEWVSEVILMVK